MPYFHLMSEKQKSEAYGYYNCEPLQRGLREAPLRESREASGKTEEDSLT